MEDVSAVREDEQVGVSSKAHVIVALHGWHCLVLIASRVSVELA